MIDKCWSALYFIIKTKMFVVTVVFYFLNMKLIVCGRNDVCLNLESIDSAHAFS